MTTRLCARLGLAVLLILTFALPALAQETSPLQTNTPRPASSDATDVLADTALGEHVPRELLEWFQQMSMAQWGITVVVLIVFGGGALVLVYRSASPATQQLIRTGVTAGAGTISEEARRRQQIALLNDIDWDDPIWAGIVAGSDKLRGLVARLPVTVTPGGSPLYRPGSPWADEQGGVG